MNSGRMWELSPTNAGVGMPKGTSAVDHVTNALLAYVFGKRTDDVFKKLKALVAPFGIVSIIYALWVHR